MAEIEGMWREKICRRCGKTFKIYTYLDARKAVNYCTDECKKARGYDKLPAVGTTKVERGPLEHDRAGRVARMGLTVAEYNTLGVGQGWVCAICKGENPGGNGRWHIDHDHACCPRTNAWLKSCGECVRGLLCAPCNMGLGMFKDSLERLTAATAYLTTRTRC